MKNKFKAHAPILSIVLSMLAVGYSFAANVVVIPLAADTPSGMVSAFNSTECPSGWQKYEKADGRFVRGIGDKPPGFTDGREEHSHVWSSIDPTSYKWSTWNREGSSFSLIDWGNGMDTAGAGNYPLAVNNINSNLIQYYYTRDAYHLPPYVYLLYCEKV